MRMVSGTKAKMKLLLLCMCLYVFQLRASAQCVDESPIPPTIPATTWTAWYSIDTPMDGTEDETHAAIKAAYPSLCGSPSRAECRVKFQHTDQVTAGQILATSCSPSGGLLCRQSEQTNLEQCLDYEIRFDCPSPNDLLPEPRFYWDLSTKTTLDADEPLTCDGTVSSIYANIGGVTGSIGGTILATDSFDSSDHLCAVRSQLTAGGGGGWIHYGSFNDKCMAEPICCTAGFTINFWMRSRIPNPTSTGAKYVMSTGGESRKARGAVIYYKKVDFVFNVRGDRPLEYWSLSVTDADHPAVDQWISHTFTFEPDVGTKYYRNGILIKTVSTIAADASKTTESDNFVMFSRNADQAVYPYRADVDMSDYKMLYRNLNDTEVQTMYLQDTTESKLLIHYMRKHSHDDSFGVELECLAKSGSSPTIVWHRSDDGVHFESISPSVDVAIYESSPNSYRRRSILIVRHLTLASDATFACEALDGLNGGSVSKIITVPKHVPYWSPWLSADNTLNGDDRETLIQHRQQQGILVSASLEKYLGKKENYSECLNGEIQQAYDLLCKYPSNIQCRTVYGGVSSNETGQIFNTNCMVSSGMECLGSDQSAAHANTCYDYEVQYQCPEPRYRWTPWYDASDPDGLMEDETFSTHMTQLYPDLCSQPIGAECRLKSTEQDLLTSGFIPEVPYLCNANGFRCQHADNIGSCPDMEVRYKCPNSPTAIDVSLERQSHHLDPHLKLKCSVTSGTPPVNIEWASVNRSHPYIATAISPGGVVMVTADTSSSSVITINDYVYSLFTNTSLVCILREGITINTDTIDITRPSVCEQSLGVSSGLIDIIQMTPSSVKVQPFTVPGLDGLYPWVPAPGDSNPLLDFDLGINFEITGVAIQGDPAGLVPSSLVNKFSLYSKDTSTDPWNLYADGVATSEFTTDYGEGTASYTTLTPYITARYIRFRPIQWTPTELRMRVEIYGCAVGESNLRILGLTKKYDVISNNFTFTCHAEHFPVPVITWLADNVTISSLEGSFQISNISGSFPTAISMLNVIGYHPANDSITFTCKAKAGEAVERASISAEYSFSGSVSINGDANVNFGANVIMTCTASGDDVYVITWGRRPAATNVPFTMLQSNGQFLIINDENSATTWDSTLTISQFMQIDEGEYACLVNSNTASASLLVSGKFGVRQGWSNATYDEKTNVYQLECAVFYSNIVPDVTWIIPNGQRIDQSTGRYQLQSYRILVSGNLTEVSTLTIYGYTYSVDDGTYVCSSKVSGQSINMTLQTQYAYLGPVFASVTKATPGQPVYLTCVANDVTQVYHADWLRVTGADKISIERGSMHAFHEDRTGGAFRLNLDIVSYSKLDDGDYICSINNGTAEAMVTLSSPTLGHGHSHGGCSGGDDHDHDPPDRGTEFSLYTKIDTDRVECLNEVTNGSGKLVFKPWDQRLDTDKYVESDDDEELLFNIPFTGNVKLKGVIVIGGNEDSHPAEMRLYKNQANMTFDDTRSDPDQVFELQRDSSGILEYNTKIARFSNVNHLSIHFSKNFGAETTIVYYIGLRGDFTQARRQEVMIVQYEAFANPKDHKTSLSDNVQQQIS